MTIGQLLNCIEGYGKRLDAEAKQTDQLNHILGEYIAYAVNSPKKYPKKPKLQEDNKIEYSGQDIQKMAKQRYGKK